MGSTLLVDDIKDTNGYITKSNGKYITTSVDSIDDLPSTGVEGQTVEVLNYWSDGTVGGGGTFVWYLKTDGSLGINYDPTSQHNGGTIFDPAVAAGVYEPDTESASTGCWVRQYDGAVNVKWFGAKGTGTVNDTSAVEKVINTFTAIIIKDGTFAVDIDTLHVTQNDTYIAQVNSTIIPYTALATNTLSLLTISANNVTLENLSMNIPADKLGTGWDAAGACVTANAASRLAILGCRFIGYYRRAVQLNAGCNNARVINNLFNSSHGIDGFSYNVNCADSDGCIISDNQIDGGQAGVVLGFGASVTSNTVISNNVINNVDEIGIDCGSGVEDTIINGNCIKNCIFGAIRYGQASYYAMRGIISNNIVTDGGTSAAPAISSQAEYGFTSRPSMDATKIIGNTVTGDCSAGISVAQGPFIIADNNITDISDGDGVQLLYRCNYSSLKNNKIYRCSSRGIYVHTGNQSQPITHVNIVDNDIVDNAGGGLMFDSAANNFKILNNLFEDSGGAGLLQPTGIQFAGNSTLHYLDGNKLLGHTTDYSFEPSTSSGYDDQKWGKWNDGNSVSYAEGVSYILNGDSTQTITLPTPLLSGFAPRYVELSTYKSGSSVDPALVWYLPESSDASNIVITRSGTTGYIKFMYKVYI